MTTVKQLRQIVNRPGIILLPVVVRNDVKHMQVVKSDVLQYLSKLDDGAPAPWAVTDEDEPGVTYLDVNDEFSNDED